MKLYSFLMISTILALHQQGCYARGRGGAFASYTERMKHNLRISSIGDACKFTSYYPGGAKVTIDNVEVPVAKVESKGLYTIFVGSEEEMGALVSETLSKAGLASTAVATIQHIKEISRLANVNPTLTVFTTMINLAFPSTTTDDVLKATNDALLKLTNQMNQQFENAKLYIDEKVLSTKKQDLREKLDKMRSQLKICFQRDPSNYVECLAEKHDDFRSDKSVFFKYKEELKKQAEKPLPSFDVHMLEATVVTAREYVMEYFLITKLILDGMKDASNEKELMAKNYFLRALKEDATASIDYFENVIEAIRHDYNRLNCVKGENMKCEPKQTSGDLTTMECTCRYLGSKDVCKVTIEENSDRSATSDGSYIYIENSKWNGDKDTEYLSNENIKKLEELEQVYRDQSTQAISRYWAEQIGVFFQVFRSIADYAEKESKLVDQKLR